MSLENQHKDFETFKKYYTGKMSHEEKSNFERELENDPFANDAYEGFLMFETDFKRISAIENTNMAFKDAHKLNESAGVFPIKTAIGIAASIVLLIGGFFIVQNNFSNSNTNLAEHKVEENKKTLEQEKETKAEQSIFVEDLEIVSDELENEIEDKTIIITDKEISEPENSEIKPTTVEKNDLSNDVKNKFDTETNKKTNGKQIGSAQFEEYHKNQKENQTEQSIFLDKDKVTENSPSVADEELAVNPPMFNTIPIQEDMLEEETEELSSMSNYKSGIVAYNQSNYKQAIVYFNNAISNKKNVNSSNYFLGMSYFNLNKATKSISYFDKVVNTSSSYADDAIWYKAISLINKGQKDRAKLILIDIINSNSGYSSAAQKKLNSIN